MLTPTIVMQWSSSQITQWQEVRKKQARHGWSKVQQCRTGDVRWMALAENRVKVNVDASLVPEAHSFSLGMVIRNHHGEFIQAKNLRYAGEISVFEAE